MVVVQIVDHYWRILFLLVGLLIEDAFLSLVEVETRQYFPAKLVSLMR